MQKHTKTGALSTKYQAQNPIDVSVTADGKLQLREEILYPEMKNAIIRIIGEIVPVPTHLSSRAN